MNGRQLNPSAVGPSRTTTLTAAPPSASQDDSEEAGVLRLRPSRPAGEPSARRVVWSEGTVDNEGLGRKKSKSMYINSIPFLAHPPTSTSYPLSLALSTVYILSHYTHAYRIR
ncbi:uncharacterized protein MEPE_02099 [Melanopsichium pennsylvanicum]|uniref:Type 1 phosphatases regulator n=2 Tax=Melanopsichium pennsylvanicum TaxID=63383 RepID=A0AAJ4XJ88_9BASI|nr:uncharacterized protein BN887_06061 [Melanopsichium pennsylvanicum 4]SNX83392.1 uncharacterized protein MEPE_02099 [Melanopsichium pennsylvanicum]